MENFIKYITQDLYSRYGSGISDLCIVFPNRRAGLYFKKYLSELTDKPLWAPATTTINELFQQISGLAIADNMKLLFELYNIYKKVKKSDESFDDFYFWGEMMLNDFDDIDKYLVNPEDLFKNLKSLKSIQDQFNYLTPEQVEAIKQFWSSFDPGKNSQHQDEFISIWNVLLEIYRLFNNHLNQSGIAYEGMMYRKVAEMVTGSQKIDFQHKKYVFVGFNALNHCEKKLFEHLQNNKLADFYWDYDESYIQNKHHEAGFFLRENIKLFKQPQSIENKAVFNSLSENKNIEIISVPSDVGQAKIITQKLKLSNQNLTDSPNKTAIVLADEELLVPVLQSIPDSIEQVNITMGYPVSNTPIYSLLEHIIELQKNARKTDSATRFYHKNVLSVLSHQYINNAFHKEAQQLVQFIKKNNRIVIGADELAVCNFFAKLFTKIEDYIDLSDYLLVILHQVYNSLKTAGSESTIHNASLEKEYIYHIYLSINRIKDILKEQKAEIRIDTYICLLRKIIRNLRVPFTGEPLSGLQVMGILETRLLDFENLFITSVNEGILPKTEAALSFVPYNLRKGFGLPTIEHQDAIYAYYFYRLLQRAKNITLLYNSNSEGLQTGEMSRYLYQLKFESKNEITEKSVRYDINLSPAKEISIEKTEEVYQRLKRFVSGNEENKYLSPSALNNYLSCKLKFYFRYIAGLEEQDEITEEIDAPLFGNILHQSMDNLYHDFKGKLVTSDDLNQLTKNNELIEKSIDSAFQQEYFKNTKTDYTGKNIIIRQVIEKYVRRILKIDQKIAPFEIISLEDKYEIEIPVNANNTKLLVKLGGKIDRVDKKDKRIRIIDYKTGSDKLEYKNIESLFSEKKEDRRSAVFQTFLYARFYKEQNKPDLTIVPGVYSVRKLFDKDFDYRIKNKEDKIKIDDYSMVEQEYMQNLSKLLHSVFDKQQAFTQTDDTRTCEYCPYRKICHR